MADDMVQGASLGTQLRRFRDAQGLTIEQVAAEAGVAELQLARLEADMVRSPRIATLEKLGRALRFRVRGPGYVLEGVQ